MACLGEEGKEGRRRVRMTSLRPTESLQGQAPAHARLTGYTAGLSLIYAGPRAALLQPFRAKGDAKKGMPREKTANARIGQWGKRFFMAKKFKAGRREAIPSFPQQLFLDAQRLQLPLECGTMEGDTRKEREGSITLCVNVGG